METAYFDLLRQLSQPIRAADLPLSLDHVRRLLAALGSPQNGYRAIVVTGSTGKGTACLRIAQLLRASGLTVGLYTSPHLHLFRERFAILDPRSAREQYNPRAVGARSIVSLQQDAAPSPSVPPRLITQAEFVDHARAVLAAQRQLDHAYSTFESATALALAWFAQQKIDIAVLEVGIGGRFDAVNAVDNDLAVFTPIEAEHIAMLGGSLESVAWHKVGIIRLGKQAISVPQVPAVMTILQQEAFQAGASLLFVPDLAAALPADLLPGGQGNLPIAPALPSLPGRLERLVFAGHPILVDGGHTPHAARYLRQYIGEAVSIRLIVGMLRDKDAAAYLSVFDAPNVHFVYTRAPADRALSPDELLERYQPTRASVTLVPSLDEALGGVETADEELIVVAGSLRTAAVAREAFGLLARDDLEEALLTRAIFAGDDYQKKLR